MRMPVPGRAPAALRTLSALLLVAAVLAAFLPVLGNGFAPLDDEKNFLRNPHYRGFSPENLRWMLTTNHMGHYIPLTWLTLGLDYELWGMRPSGYHLTSLLLHLANALLFLALARRLLARALSRGREVPEAWAVEAGALAAALLFAVHPLRVESVAWVSERRDVLCGLFTLLSVHAYVSAVMPARLPRSEGRRRARLLAGSCLLFAAALLAKGIAVALPVALVALDVAVLGRLPPSPRAWLGRDYRGVWREKLPYLGIALASVVSTLWAIRYVLVPSATLSLSSRLAAAGYGLTLYLEKTLAPVRLPLVIPWTAGVDLRNPPYALRALLLAAAAAALLALGRRRPGRSTAVTAALATYAAFVLPVSGLLQAGPQLAAYRYTYLSCLPWALLAGAGVVKLVRMEARRSPRAPRLAVVLLLALAVTVALVARTRRQVALWHDGYTFSRAAVEGAPAAWQPRYSLTIYHLRAGRWDEAARQVRIGLLHNPGAGALPLVNLGGLLFATCPDARVRDGGEALLLAERAVRDTSYQDPWAIFTLAAALAENGDAARAAAAARTALPLARRHGIPELAARLEAALPLFERGLPLRMGPEAWSDASSPE